MDRILAGCAAITWVICESTPGESAVGDKQRMADGRHDVLWPSRFAPCACPSGTRRAGRSSRPAADGPPTRHDLVPQLLPPGPVSKPFTPETLAAKVRAVLDE